MSKLFITADLFLISNNKDQLQAGGMLIEDSTIEWIGPLLNAPNVESAEKINFPNCTILPGLIDSHVHLSLTGKPDPWEEMVNDTPVIAAIKATESAKKTLQYGVTYVRDMGSKNGVVIEVGQAIDQNIIHGSQVIATGRCIVMTGGHAYPIGVEIDGEDKARRAARLELKKGAKGLKVMATGGVLTPGVEPGSPQLTIREMLAVTEEAHKAGFLVGAHAHGTEGIKNAIKSNCDTIEHCSYLDDDTIELFLQKGTTMVSTLIATELLISKIDDPRIQPYVAKKIKTHAGFESKSLRKAIKAGIEIIAGSDSGTAFNPHNQLIQEIKLLVSHGMTEISAIKAATIKPAKKFGKSDSIGSLDKGKAADFLVVDGNPLTNIESLEKIHAVFKNGEKNI